MATMQVQAVRPSRFAGRSSGCAGAALRCSRRPHGWVALLGAAAFLLTPVAAAPWNGNPYLDDPTDPDAMRTGREKMEEYCAGDVVKSGDDLRKKRKKALERGVGGDNIVKKILTQAKDADDFDNQVEANITVGWLMSKAGPIVCFFIIIFVYLICCWTACPCCRCCRCGAKERKWPVLVKIIVFVLVALLFVGIIISGSVGTAGYRATRAGFDSMACTSARLLNTTLGGRADPHFIGMVPMLEEVHGMSSLLSPESNFMKDLVQIVDSTESIDTAVKVAAGTMSLLQDTLALPGNAVPGGAAKMHECRMCTELSKQLEPVVDLFSNGLATMLADARAEVKKQLMDAGATDLTGTLTEAASPLVEVKDMIRDAFVGFVGGDSVTGIRKALKDMEGGVALLLLWALLHGLFALLVMACFTCKEKWNHSLKTTSDGVQKNPYNKWVHRCACCNWCCGFIFMMFALLSGGIFTMISVPMSGMCLVLDEMNSDLLLDIMPALGSNMSKSDDFKVIGKIIDSCFMGLGGDNPNLMDIITVGNETLREKTVGMVKKEINKMFDQIEGSSLDDAKIADNEEVNLLVKTLSENSMDTMMLPDPERIAQDARFLPLLQGSAALQKFVATSLACESETPKNLGDFDEEIPGLKPFAAALKDVSGTSVFLWPRRCGNDVGKVTCPVTPGQNKLICEAGNEYLDLKFELLDLRTYKCNIFKDPDYPSMFPARKCDPLNMAKVGDRWTNDCMTKSDGTVVPLEVGTVDCTLPEFVTYMKEFGPRLEKVLKRCDDDVADTQTRVTVDMRNLVDVNVIGAIDRLANGAGCGFLAESYSDFLTGFCYQGVWGFVSIANAYVACAVFVLGLVVLIYAVWRGAIDNVNKWEPEVLL
eukprot:TRINITY_DN4170_c1_g1_i1.p1 TRINITY_DN4170_c1_g1~~TRINITY_DN4170_c1_g1_i1.p1  ORF type:complete len:903 (+),score=179.44 TRINITY_DN4170_c1_g1_i1:77-2710(+)